MVSSVFKTSCFVLSTGSPQSPEVLQKPSFIIKSAGESVVSEIHCSHSTPNYDHILWFKQDGHRALKFLGYLNINQINIEEDVKGKVSFKGNGKSYSNLTISKLELNDNAVYFCAVRQHNAADSAPLPTKTLLCLAARPQPLNTCSQPLSGNNC